MPSLMNRFGCDEYPRLLFHSLATPQEYIRGYGSIDHSMVHDKIFEVRLRCGSSNMHASENTTTMTVSGYMRPFLEDFKGQEPPKLLH